MDRSERPDEEQGTGVKMQSAASSLGGRSAQDGGYLVPVDPMEDLGCDSCE